MRAGKQWRARDPQQWSADMHKLRVELYFILERFKESTASVGALCKGYTVDHGSPVGRFETGMHFGICTPPPPWTRDCQVLAEGKHVGTRIRAHYEYMPFPTITWVAIMARVSLYAES